MTPLDKRTVSNTVLFSAKQRAFNGYVKSTAIMIQMYHNCGAF
jgi:hypothetical protein